MPERPDGTVTREGPASANCPPSERIVEVLEGRVDSAARQRLDVHLRSCADCAELMSALRSQVVAETRLDASPCCASSFELSQFAHGELDEAARIRVSRHLIGCAACKRRLARVEAGEGLADTEVEGDAGTPAESLLPPGTRAGRFVVDGLLGQGGMGVVYRALDPELGRAVALKVVRVGSAGPAGSEARRSRAVREAQAMARLSHPNVVQIFEVGERPEGVFIAMELVEGQTLRRWGASKPRTQQEILDCLIAAGAGLVAAHAVGIVHRDFKPDNVLIANDGRVRVTDFGLARLDAEPSKPGSPPPRQTSEDIVAHHTADGLVVGTPAFMAPEQANGAVVDHRCDQFSFCVSAFLLLTGGPPFANRNPHRRESDIREGRFSQPATGSRVSRRTLSALQRGMSFNPEARFASMRLLLDQLKPRPVISRRALVAGAGVLGLGLVAGQRWLNPVAPLFSGRVLVGLADTVNHTRLRELDSLSGLLASLVQSEHCEVLPRALVIQTMRAVTGEAPAQVSPLVLAKTAAALLTQVALVPTLREVSQGLMLRVEAIHPTRGEAYFGLELEAADSQALAAGLSRLATSLHLRLVASPELAARTARAPNLTRDLEAYHFYAMAERLWEAQEPDAARVECLKAIALDPNFAMARYRLATALAWVGASGAQEQLEAAMSRRDKLPWKEARYIEAFDLFIRRDRTAAREVWSDVLQRFPRDREALWWMADSLFHDLRSAEAVPYFDRLLVVASDYRPASEHGTRANLIAGRFDRALELARLNSLDRRDEGPSILLAVALDYANRSADTDLALARLRQLGLVRRVRLYEADLAASRGDFEAFERSPEPAAEVQIGQICRARLAAMSARFEEADSAYTALTEAATERDDRRSLALHHAEHALVHLGQGHLQRARSLFAAAFEHRHKARLEDAWLMHLVGVRLDEPHHDWFLTKAASSPETRLVVEAHQALAEGDAALAAALFLKGARGMLGTAGHYCLYFGLRAALGTKAATDASALAALLELRRPDQSTSETGLRMLLWPELLLMAVRGHQVAGRTAEAQRGLAQAERVLARADRGAGVLTALAHARKAQ